MNNTRDLHFQKEIIPLFDFTGNEYARAFLVQLLTEMPRSVAEILERQGILKNLLAAGGSASSLSYHPLEFAEVYSYLKEAGNREVLEGSHIIWQRWFHRVAFQREIGRLTQLIVFLYKIDKTCFSIFSANQFSGDFALQLDKIHFVLKELDIAKYEAIIRSKGLKSGDIRILWRRLGHLSREGHIEAFWRAFFLFEAYWSIAQGIRKKGFVFPQFAEGRELTISGVYHPLVSNPVRNDLRVAGPVTLITGPNMSGKSTLLKSIGLCVVLAHLGVAVPAERLVLGYFDVISIAIDLNDDLLKGYSHFMMEIVNLKNVVVEARRSKRCFAIFDELFRGTNPEDALRISTRTIEGLAGFSDCLFFISTHLHQLRNELQVDREKICIRHIECRLSDDKPLFTYKLADGWSELTIGQLLFEQSGLNRLLG